MSARRHVMNHSAVLFPVWLLLTLIHQNPCIVSDSAYVGHGIAEWHVNMQFMYDRCGFLTSSMSLKRHGLGV
eukprot:3450326-Karenia_brevis.AAC.1